MIHIAIICPEDFDKDQSYEDNRREAQFSTEHYYLDFHNKIATARIMGKKEIEIPFKEASFTIASDNDTDKILFLVKDETRSDDCKRCLKNNSDSECGINEISK